MPSILLRICILSTCLLLAWARPREQIPGGAFAIGGVDDWDSSGNYLIYSCGSDVPTVKNILDLTYLSLQTAILSTDGSAYTAFFRTATPSSVTAVLDAITAGANITTAFHGSRRPTLVCVNPVDEQIRGFWTICNDPDNAPVAIQPPGSSIVFLCPIFFTLKPLPLPADCGVVNHASTRLIPRTHITATRYGFLVQVLADMYIWNLSGRSKVMDGDVAEENACLALPPQRALTNPSSYAFYASNVRAGCTRFPTRVRIQDDRELLALDGAGNGNGTGVLTINCAAAGVNTTACSL